MASAKADKNKTSAKPPKTGKSNISTQLPDLERRNEALEWRLRGYSFKAIGEALDPPCSAQRAYELVADGLAVAKAEHTEKASEVLQFEIKRIDRMIAGLQGRIFVPDVVYEKASEEQKAEFDKMSLKAMEMADRFLDRKARLLGFYRTDDSKVKEPLPWSDTD